MPYQIINDIYFKYFGSIRYKYNEKLCRLCCIFFLGFFPVFIIHETAFATNATDGKNTPSEVIAAFVEAEYQGVQDSRESYVYVIPAKRKKNSFDDTIISLDSDPLVVVKNYKLGSVLIDGQTSLIKVQYRLIARTEGWGLPGRKFLLAKDPSETVTYKLFLHNGEWKIVDPPLPRISVRVMVSQYEGQIYSMNKIMVDPRVSSAQRNVLNTLKIELEKLRNFEKLVE